MMTRILIVAAFLGTSLSAAGACEFMRSVEADVDQTVVASVATDEQKKMSLPVVVPDVSVPDKARDASE